MPKTKKSELTWRAIRPGELVTLRDDGVQLRIKLAVSQQNGKNFWYCYSGSRYVGIQHEMETAKVRTESGLTKVTAEELEQWLKDHPDLDPVLRESEKDRLKDFKKNPPKKMAEAPPPPVAKGVRKAEAAASAVPGKVSGGMVVRVVKGAAFTGKEGTKWRARQEHVFSMDGKTVAAVGDNDAVKHMLKDGTITVEGK